MELFGLKYKTIQSANDLNNLYNLVVCGNKLEEFDVILFNTSILTSNKIPEKFRHKIRDTDTSINKFAIMFKGYNWNRIVIDDIDDFEKKALELARIIPAKFTWIISATVDRFYQKYHYEKIHRSNKLYYSLNLGASIMRLFTIKCNDKFIEEQTDMPFIKAYLHSMNANTSRDKLNLLNALRYFYNFYQIYKFSAIPRILFDNFNQGYYNINSLYEISQTDSILSVLSIVFFLYQKIIDKMQSMLEIISKCKTTNAVIKKSTYGIDVLNSLLKSLDDSTFMTKLYTFDMQKIEEDTKAEIHGRVHGTSGQA